VTVSTVCAANAPQSAFTNFLETATTFPKSGYPETCCNLKSASNILRHYVRFYPSNDVKIEEYNVHFNITCCYENLDDLVLLASRATHAGQGTDLMTKATKAKQQGYC
jgi:hypothetical protein